jgi:RNA polymerase sigma factor (sigma-70 family)
MSAHVAAGAALDREAEAEAEAEADAEAGVPAEADATAEGGATAGGGASTGLDAAAGHPLVEPFEAFYRAHVDRVYRALAVTLGDPQLAREATDEAMTRSYAHWSRLRKLDNPGGWAYRVGLNWATSWWRKRRREWNLPVTGHRSVAPPDPAATAAQQALAELALPMRTVVVCRILLDMSTVETASLLGVPEGTVKSRLARGLAALRAALAEPLTNEES